ncbi:hypothetical protein MHYP_G00357880 [Metynnis hypsauchen]
MGVTTQLAGPRARLWAAICFEMLERLTEGTKYVCKDSQQQPRFAPPKFTNFARRRASSVPGRTFRLISAGIGSQSDGPLEQTLVTSNLASGH